MIPTAPALRPEHNRGDSYREDIDGLRALAVMAVVFFHADLGLLGGYVGVDIFFVISGYLIVGIIDRELSNKSFSLTEFWSRRFRRILPASSFVVAITLTVSYFLLLPHDFREFGQSLVAQALGLSNLYFYRESGYFSTAAELKPLLHTWSLAVEEQFYIVIPIILLVASKFSRNFTLIILLAITATSMLLSITDTPRYPNAAFFLLPSRAWELGLGGLIALTKQQSRNIPALLADPISLIGLSMCLYSMLAFTDKTAFPGAAAIVPCLGTALIILSGESTKYRSILYRLLSLGYLRWLGKISFSLYLWHWPLFAFYRYHTFGKIPTLIATFLILLSLSLAFLSWHFIEEPFRRKEFLKNRHLLFTLSFLSLGAFFLTGLQIHFQNGFPSRFSSEVARVANARNNRSPLSKIHHDTPIDTLMKNGFPKIGDPHASANTLILGDSHGDALAPALEHLLKKEEKSAMFVTRSGTLPLLFNKPNPVKENDRFLAAVKSIAESTPNLRNLVLIGRWHWYHNELVEDRLLYTIKWAQHRDIKLYIVSQVPEAKSDIPRMLALSQVWKWEPKQICQTFHEYSELDHKFLKTLDNFQHLVSLNSIAVIPLGKHFFDEQGLSILTIDCKPLYRDDNHLSTEGAMYAAPFLESTFSSMLP